MATIAAEFIPAMWSDALVNQLKKDLVMNHFGELVPKRSRGTQLLRDAALGHKEFPGTGVTTATEVRIRNEYANHAADAMAYAIDRAIITSIVNRAKP